MTKEIMITNQDGQFVVSSREVAKNFEKQHKHVLDAIDKLVLGVAEKSASFFIPTTYVHESNGGEYREYLLTRNGFSLVVMGFTGDKALEWKLKYIEAFDKMEEALKQRPVVKEPPVQASPVETLKSTQSFLEFVLPHYESVGVSKESIAVYTGSIIDYAGIPAPKMLVQIEQKYYNASDIARQAGILSSSGKPHSQAVSALISTFPLEDGDYTTVLTTAPNGKQVPSREYTQKVIGLVKDYILSNDYPTTISVNGKNFKVQYK